MPDNTLYYGDNLDILGRYVKDDSIDLIYLDPPFNSKANYNVTFEDYKGEKSAAQLQAFKDTWSWPEAALTYEELTLEPTVIGDALRAFGGLLHKGGQLEEYNDSLQSQVEKLKSEITEKNQQITSLSEEGAQKRSEVEQVKKEKEELNKKVVYLERIRKELKPVQHQAEVTSRTIADYDLFVIALAKYIENLSPNERERFVNALVASSLPKASILETLHSKNKPGIVTWLDFIEKDKRP